MDYSNAHHNKDGRDDPADDDAGASKNVHDGDSASDDDAVNDSGNRAGFEADDEGTSRPAVGDDTDREAEAGAFAAHGAGRRRHGALATAGVSTAQASLLAHEARRTLTLLDEQLDGLLTALEAPGLSGPASATLTAAVTEVCLFADAAAARYARTLAAVPALVEVLEYASPSSLLQHELGFTSRRAQDAVAVGRLLQDRRYPSLATAITDGAVSVCQAAQVVRALDDVADDYDEPWIRHAEAAITDFATGGDDLLPAKPERLRTLLQSWLARHAPETTTTEHESQWRKRTCTVAVRDDGMLHLRALLPPESGAAVLEYLDAHASPRVRFTDLNDPNPTPTDDGTGELADTRTRGQKMADGLARAFHAAASADAPTQGGAAPVLTITIPKADLDTHANGRPALAELPRTGTHVPAHVAARVACDGIIQAAVTGTDGEVLYLGRTQRLFSPKQKQALALTYTTCAAGGCDIPARWCEAHHAIPWSRGGQTDLPDGILVCNFHHHQIHQDNLTIERPPGSGRLRIRRRKPRHRQPSGSEPGEAER